MLLLHPIPVLLGTAVESQEATAFLRFFYAGRWVGRFKAAPI